MTNDKEAKRHGIDGDEIQINVEASAAGRSSTPAPVNYASTRGAFSIGSLRRGRRPAGGRNASRRVTSLLIIS